MWNRPLQILASVALLLPAPLPGAQDYSFFEKRIRPVLAESCYACHSAEAAAKGKLKAGLAVDSREGLLRGGESGPAVTPGRPDASPLLSALKHEGWEMPPSGKLSPEIVADFERWIRDGAPDPRDGQAASAKRGMTIEEGRKFWSFVTPVAASPPEVMRASWSRDAIDRFILAKLEAQGLTPAPDADPQTLFVRAHFDLVGLPPEPEEVAQFVAMPSRAAFEATVDRLLASPRFGERWGRHWLDLARYADSNGRDRNVYFHHAWRYRDYVIDSFNADKPFDRFVMEQIAGDLLPVETAAGRDEGRIATGFLALGAKAFEEKNPDVFHMDVVDEQIEVVSRAVLGLSIGCARCHDHKFDPIPTADYYALAGIFRSTQPLYGYGPKGIKAGEFANSDLQPLGLDAERLGPPALAYLAELHRLTLVQNTARSDRYRVVRQVSAKKIELTKPDADKPALEGAIAELEATIKEWDVTVKQAESALQAAMDAPPPMPALAMAVREGNPADCRIHVRGDTAQLGDLVPRGMPRVVPLSGIDTIDGQSGRLQLAHWLADRDNPLTARVIVNRVWLHLLGRGLVASPDDFGVSGARPSHPELLDHLAVTFQDEGWSIKRLVRRLVLSRTYGLASDLSGPAGSEQEGDADSAAAMTRQREVDPDGALFGRMRLRRLEAEVLRDRILWSAGTLVTGPPRPDETPFGKHNPYREDEYRTFKPLFGPTDLESSRRGVYLPVVRGVLPELLGLFDFAPPERTVGQRDESVVPAQALYFMNNAWVAEQSRHMARRALSAESLDTAGKISLLYGAAFSRHPTAAETRRASDYVFGDVGAASGSQGDSAAEVAREERWAYLCQMLLASAEFAYVR